MNTEKVEKASPLKKRKGLLENQDPSTLTSDDAHGQHPLVRAIGQTMQPKSLSTGYYGARGERIRHMVHDGALKLPLEALELITEKDERSEDAALQQRRPVKIVLPGLDSVVRPSIDPKLDSMIVTDLNSVVVPGDATRASYVKTVAQNRTVNFGGNASAEAERMRGGGNETEQDDIEMKEVEGVASEDVQLSTIEKFNNPQSSTSNMQQMSSSTSTGLGSQGSTQVAAATAASTSQASEPVTTASTGTFHDGTAKEATVPPSVAVPSVHGIATNVSQPLHTPIANLSSSHVPLPPFSSSQSGVPNAVPNNLPQGLQSSSLMQNDAAVHSQNTVPHSSAPTSTAPSAAQAVEQPLAAGSSQQISVPTSSLTPAANASGSQHNPSSVSSSQKTASAPQAIYLPTTATQRVPALPNAGASSIATVTSGVPNSNTTSTTAPVTSAQGSSQPEPQVIPLKKTPVPQWEQHKPGPNDETQVDPATRVSKPDWYKADAVSSLEKSILTEWFDSSAPHRTEASYLLAREKMIRMSDTLGNRYLTTTMVRRAIPGDVGSLMRLFHFLLTYALINECATNDSAPTPLILQPTAAIPLINKRKRSIWESSQVRTSLMEAVVDSVKKRQQNGEELMFNDDFWQNIAKEVGNDTTAEECQRQFMTLPVEAPLATTAATTSNSTGESTNESELSAVMTEEALLEKLVDSADSSILSRVTDAALQATNDVIQAKKAAAVGLVASQAMEEAKSHQESVARILAELVDVRMQKLENRLSLLEDVEGILEAERVALELERRDLYTARCRYWFGSN